MRVVQESILLLANKLPSWSFDGWIRTSVKSRGGNNSNGGLLFGCGKIVCFGVVNHGGRNNVVGSVESFYEYTAELYQVGLFHCNVNLALWLATGYLTLAVMCVQRCPQHKRVRFKPC